VLGVRARSKLQAPRVPTQALESVKNLNSQGGKVRATQRLSFTGDNAKITDCQVDTTLAFDYSFSDFQDSPRALKASSSALVPPFVLAPGDHSIGGHGYQLLAAGATDTIKNLNGSSLVEQSPFLSGDDQLFVVLEDRKVHHRANLSRKLLKLHKDAVQFIPSKPGKTLSQVAASACFA